MIPLTFLCDEYIDRPKLSEQKKTFEFIVPPPTSGVGTIIKNGVVVERDQRLYRILKDFGEKFV